jgi:hypothetical protein
MMTAELDDKPFYLSLGEAYMDGNADAFHEMHGWLTCASVGTPDNKVRAALLVAAEHVKSRQRTCDKSRWEMRNERASDWEPIPTKPEVPGLFTLLRWLWRKARR